MIKPEHFLKDGNLKKFNGYKENYLENIFNFSFVSVTNHCNQISNQSKFR